MRIPPLLVNKWPARGRGAASCGRVRGNCAGCHGSPAVIAHSFAPHRCTLACTTHGSAGPRLDPLRAHEARGTQHAALKEGMGEAFTCGVLHRQHNWMAHATHAVRPAVAQRVRCRRRTGGTRGAGVLTVVGLWRRPHTHTVCERAARPSTVERPSAQPGAQLAQHCGRVCCLGDAVRARAGVRCARVVFWQWQCRA